MMPFYEQDIKLGHTGMLSKVLIFLTFTLTGIEKGQNFPMCMMEKESYAGLYDFHADMEENPVCIAYYALSKEQYEMKSLSCTRFMMTKVIPSTRPSKSAQSTVGSLVYWH